MQQILNPTDLPKKHQDQKINPIREAKEVTVGTKYQIVIPKEVRNNLRGLEPGMKLNVSLLEDGTIGIKLPNPKWSDQNYGSLQKQWQGVDLLAEVDKIRNE